MNITSRTFRRSVVVGVAVTMAVVAATAFSAGVTSPASAQSTTPSPSGTRGAADPTGIAVTGIGRVSVTPDTVTVQLGVETRAATAGAALKDNNTRAAALIKLLKDQGVADRDLQTTQLSINPQTDNTGRRITGYVVSNMVTAKVRGVDKAGPLIDAAAASAGDAIRVQGVSFSVNDPTAATAQARKAAVADARAQAAALADAAGVKLGALRRIEGSSSSVAPPIPYQAKVADLAAGVSLEAGSQEVSSTVSMVFDFA